MAPGAIKTNIDHEDWSILEAERALRKLNPYGCVGVPAGAAKPAVWLASVEAECVTGNMSIVDGGMSLYPAFHGNG